MIVSEVLEIEDTLDGILVDIIEIVSGSKSDSELQLQEEHNSFLTHEHEMSAHGHICVGASQFADDTA